MKILNNIEFNSIFFFFKSKKKKKKVKFSVFILSFKKKRKKINIVKAQLNNDCYPSFITSLTKQFPRRNRLSFNRQPPWALGFADTQRFGGICEAEEELLRWNKKIQKRGAIRRIYTENPENKAIRRKGRRRRLEEGISLRNHLPAELNRNPHSAVSPPSRKVQVFNQWIAPSNWLCGPSAGRPHWNRAPNESANIPERAQWGKEVDSQRLYCRSQSIDINE